METMLLIKSCNLNLFNDKFIANPCCNVDETIFWVMQLCKQSLNSIIALQMEATSLNKLSGKIDY